MESVRRISSSHGGGNVAAALRQYYVAVGIADVQLATLVDLLLALQAGGSVSLAVHCGSRDSLDEVAAGLGALPATSVTCLHADLSQSQLEAAVASFAGSSGGGSSNADSGGAVAQQPATTAAALPGDTNAPAGNDGAESIPDSSRGSGERGHRSAQDEGGGDVQTSILKQSVSVLLMSDVGMRALEGRAPLLQLPLFVHYDLPVRKEVFARRAAVAAKCRPAHGAPAIVVYFVVAGKVADFRTVEGHAGGAAVIAEMPVHVAELFGGAS